MGSVGVVDEMVIIFTPLRLIRFVKFVTMGSVGVVDEMFIIFSPLKVNQVCNG
jgi:hypothetical protein